MKFIAVLFRALQKLGVLAAKIFELIDEIYSHLCLISCSFLRRNIALIQSISPGSAHGGLVSEPIMQQLFDSFFDLAVIHEKLFRTRKAWFIVLIAGT